MTNRPDARRPGRAVGLRAGLRAPEAGQAGLRAGSTSARVKKAAETSKAAFRVHTGEGPARHRRRHPRGRDPAHGGRPRRRDRVVRARGRAARTALDYDEPEPLPFSARHWLGAALHRSEALRRRRDGLPRGPQGASAQRLVAARPAAGARRRGADTSAVDQELAASWARSDTWIRSSRF